MSEEYQIERDSNLDLKIRIPRKKPFQTFDLECIGVAWREDYDNVLYNCYNIRLGGDCAKRRCSEPEAIEWLISLAKNTQQRSL